MAAKKIKMAMSNLGLKSPPIHRFLSIVCSSNEQESLTSASTVPAPAQDSGSHSVCERQVGSEPAGSSFSTFHYHITA